MCVISGKWVLHTILFVLISTIRTLQNTEVDGKC